MKLALPIILATAFVALVALPGLGDRDFWPPDEARYGGVSRSLELGAPWPVPHLNGEVYHDKPPGYFWVVRGVAALRGTRVDEFSARLPSVIGAAILAALVVAWLGRSLGGAGGLLGAALLLGSYLFSFQARYAQLDLLFAAVIGLMMACFYRASGTERPARWCLVAFVLLFAALFVKGPVALLGLAVALSWALLERRPRTFLNAGSAVGALLVLALAAAWLGWAYQVQEARGAGLGREYLDRAIGHNVVERAQKGLAHEKPFYFYLWNFPVDLLPFAPLLLLLLLARVRAAIDAPAMRLLRFCALWIVLFVAVMSVFKGKRAIYLLPLHLPAAMMLAIIADAAARTAAGWVRAAAGSVGAILVLAGVAVFGLAYSEELSREALRLAGGGTAPRLVARLEEAGLALFGAESFPLRRDLLLFGAVAAGGGLSALLLALAARPRAALGAAAAAFALAFGVALGRVAPYADLYSSRRNVAEMVREQVGDGRGHSIGIFNHLDEGVGYYLDRPLPEVASRRDEDDPADREAARREVRTFLERPGALLIIKRDDLEDFGLDSEPGLRVVAERPVSRHRFLLVEREP